MIWCLFILGKMWNLDEGSSLQGINCFFSILPLGKINISFSNREKICFIIELVLNIAVWWTSQSALSSVFKSWPLVWVPTPLQTYVLLFFFFLFFFQPYRVVVFVAIFIPGQKTTKQFVLTIFDQIGASHLFYNHYIYAAQQKSEWFVLCKMWPIKLLNIQDKLSGFPLLRTTQLCNCGKKK